MKQSFYNIESTHFKLRSIALWDFGDQHYTKSRANMRKIFQARKLLESFSIFALYVNTVALAAQSERYTQGSAKKRPGRW